MNTKETAEKILSLAKQYGAEFCEVVVNQNEFALKRIKQGQVDQPPAGEQWGIDAALVKNNRRKAVSFDNPMFAEDAIRETLSHMELLREQEPVLPGEPYAQAAQPKNLFDEKTAEGNEQELIEIVRHVNKALQEHDLLLSGKIAQGRGETTYGNSVGTAQTAQFTFAAAACFAFDKDDPLISAYADSGGTAIRQIEKERIISELIHKCALARNKERIDLFANKQEGESLAMDVIAEPYFFEPIFAWLGFFGFNGLFVQRGDSFISNKIGQQVTGENMSIADDPFDSRNRGIGFPFDFEGKPRTRIPLLVNGVAANAVYDSALAKKWNQRATCNALPPSQRSEGAVPFDLVVEGGDTPIEEMIRNSKKPTLWVTRLHYPGMKHYESATMTGVAQHGVFLVENGEVVAPVENVRFEESIPEALKRVEAMSKPRLVFAPLRLGMPGGVVAPAMKIRDFRFVGSTKRTV